MRPKSTPALFAIALACATLALGASAAGAAKPKPLPTLPLYPFGIVSGTAQSATTHVPAPGICVQAIKPDTTVVAEVLTNVGGGYSIAGLSSNQSVRIGAVDCATRAPLLTSMGLPAGPFFTPVPDTITPLPFLNIQEAVPAPCASNCPPFSVPMATGAPGVPTNVKATVSRTTGVTVTWSAPTTGGGIPYGVYYVRSYPSGAITQVDSSVTSLHFADPAGHRRVSVLARNQLGISPESKIIKAKRVKP